MQRLQEQQPALSVKSVGWERFPMRRALNLANCAQKASFQQSGRRHQCLFASPARLASIQNRRVVLPPQTANFAMLASTAQSDPPLCTPDVLQASFRLLRGPRLRTAAFFAWQGNILQSLPQQLALIVP